MARGLRALLRVPDDVDLLPDPEPCQHPVLRPFCDVVTSEAGGEQRWTAYVRVLCRSCGERFSVLNPDLGAPRTELVLELEPAR